MAQATVAKRPPKARPERTTPIEDDRGFVLPVTPDHELAERARELIGHTAIKRLKPGFYTMAGSKEGEGYRVDTQRLECDCPQNSLRRQTCKHLLLAAWIEEIVQ